MDAEGAARVGCRDDGIIEPRPVLDLEVSSMSNAGENRPGPGGPARRPEESRQGAKPPPGGSATPRRRPEKPFIPFDRFEDVVARCGHVEKFGLLPDGKDKFREGRRKKAM